MRFPAIGAHRGSRGERKTGASPTRYGTTASDAAVQEWSAASKLRLSFPLNTCFVQGKGCEQKDLCPFKKGRGPGEALQRFSEILCFFCGETTLVEGRDGTFHVEGFCIT